MTTKQIVALITGILGGLFGILASLGVLGLGGVAGVIGYEKAGEVVGRGVLTIFLSILGMIGAGIVGTNPKASGTLMLISAIVGFFAIFHLYILASALFLVGGILAFFE